MGAVYGSENITVEEYMNHALKTGIIWLGRLCINPLSSFQISNTITVSVNNPWAMSIDEMKAIFTVYDISCRRYVIKSPDDWMSFINSCYSLACVEPAQNWVTLGGKKKQFLQWMNDEGARQKAEDPQQDTSKKCSFFKYDDSIFRCDNFLVTTYDSAKKKRLIIAGLHRAAALHQAYTQFESYCSGVERSVLRVYE